MTTNKAEPGDRSAPTDVEILRAAVAALELRVAALEQRGQLNTRMEFDLNANTAFHGVLSDRGD